MQRLLGKGSFGQVHRVQRLKDGRVYALKTILLARLDSKARQDALNEVRFLASLQHPHIVRFHEAFVQAAHRRLCIVMEYAAGGDLAGVLRRRRRLPEGTIWRYAGQIAGALQYLHRRRILHRDLKPANCFLDRQGDIKLGDLNVSRRVRPNCLARTQVGTPYYMGPEIWQGRPYGAACDIWALGCLLHQLATLEVPFRGRSMAQLGRNVQRGRIPPLPPPYSGLLADTVRTMLHPRPQRRPTAEAVVAMLRLPAPDGGQKKAASGDQTMLPTIRLTPHLRRLRMPPPQYALADKPQQLPAARRRPAAGRPAAGRPSHPPARRWRLPPATPPRRLPPATPPATPPRRLPALPFRV